jgi:hypothetical protein
MPQREPFAFTNSEWRIPAAAVATPFVNMLADGLRRTCRCPTGRRRCRHGPPRAVRLHEQGVFSTRRDGRYAVRHIHGLSRASGGADAQLAVGVPPHGPEGAVRFHEQGVFSTRRDGPPRRLRHAREGARWFVVALPTDAAV